MDPEHMMKIDTASSTEPWKNVLVAIDGSQESMAILDGARHLLARESLAVTFLRVIECSESDARDPAYRTDSRHSKAREMLSTARAAFAGLSGTSNAEFCFGDPATEILRELAAGDHDAVLMNWHGDRRLAEGVAERVLLSSPVPILYFPAPAGEVGAPTNPRRFERILVMLDGSPEAEDIRPSAERMARTLGSDLHLFQAVAPGEDEAARQHATNQYLSGLAHHLGSRGVVCEGHLRSGPPVDAVAGFLEESQVDALALTTPARSTLTTELLGSVRVPVLTLSRRRPLQAE
jgi:nucleotide-binding universal stress UspA family protein